MIDHTHELRGAIPNSASGFPKRMYHRGGLSARIVGSALEVQNLGADWRDSEWPRPGPATMRESHHDLIGGKPAEPTKPLPTAEQMEAQPQPAGDRGAAVEPAAEPEPEPAAEPEPDKPVFQELVYPCGCKASGPGTLPNYCPEHGTPEPDKTPVEGSADATQ